MLACSNNFVPALQHTVNINKYAIKIRDKAQTFEAWSNNTLVGLIAVYMNDPKLHTAFITSVSVLATMQGKGIANQLLTFVINKATELHYITLQLEVNKANNTAIQLYTKNGFTKLATNETITTMQIQLPQQIK